MSEHSVSDLYTPLCRVTICPRHVEPGSDYCLVHQSREEGR